MPKEACPLCGANLVIREGKWGTFVGCTAYPKCRYTRKIDKQEEKGKEQVLSAKTSKEHEKIVACVENCNTEQEAKNQSKKYDTTRYDIKINKKDTNWWQVDIQQKT